MCRARCTRSNSPRTHHEVSNYRNVLFHEHEHVIYSVSFGRATEGAAQRAARRPAPLLDQRRADRGAPARVEQEDDHEPGVAHLRHPLQLAADVRARQIRQEPEAGAAAQRLHRRAAGRAGHALRQQQQQPPARQARQGGARGAAPRQLGARHRVQPHVQPVHAGLLSRVPAGLPHAAQHAAPAAAGRQGARAVPGHAHGAGLAGAGGEGGGLQERPLQGELGRRGGRGVPRAAAAAAPARRAPRAAAPQRPGLARRRPPTTTVLKVVTCFVAAISLRRVNLQTFNKH